MLKTWVHFLPQPEKVQRDISQNSALTTKLQAEKGLGPKSFAYYVTTVIAKLFDKNVALLSLPSQKKPRSDPYRSPICSTMKIQMLNYSTSLHSNMWMSSALVLVLPNAITPLRCLGSYWKKKRKGLRCLKRIFYHCSLPCLRGGKVCHSPGDNPNWRSSHSNWRRRS